MGGDCQVPYFKGFKKAVISDLDELVTCISKCNALGMFKGKRLIMVFCLRWHFSL
jgi:hypothetical protein